MDYLYFYNSELKDKIFADLKKKIKITKERIPAATQLFTPDWIVKYMVENSLGRLWLEGHPDSDLKYKWKYYVEEADQDEEVNLKLVEIRKESEKLKPEDVKIIDPCMGSGHILIYVFEVLMQIYISEGYTEKDATISILKNNLYGLDIDDRAYQLAYFSIMMKARSYNRKIFKQGIKPLIYPIKESNLISKEFINYCIYEQPEIKEELLNLLNDFNNAKEYGSILNVSNYDLNKFYQLFNNFKNNNLNKYNYINDLKLLKNILNQNKILSYKYDVVITNPPYMGSKSMDSNLKKYLSSNYPDSKADLFAVFIEKCYNLTKKDYFFSMITQQTFMFLSTFENLRKKLLENNIIINMAHLGAHAFDEIGGEVVQATTFILKKISIKNYNSTFHRLIDFNSEKNKEIEFFNDKNRYIIQQEKFNIIPNSPIDYWINSNTIIQFAKSKKIKDYINYTGSFHKTANNDKYLRYFWEIDLNNINKWKHYNKGGKFRRWYGNNELLVKWDEKSIKYYSSHKTANLFNKKFWNVEGITWTSLTSGKFNARYFEKGFISDFKGSSVYPKSNLYYMLAYMNSIVFEYLIGFIAPTIDFNIGQVINIPYIYNYDKNIENLSKMNVHISKKYWDQLETSFDFKKNKLIKNNDKILKKINPTIRKRI